MARPSSAVSRRYASLSDAAEYIGVNEKTIRRYIAAGGITGYRLGNRIIRINLDELDALLKPIPTAKAG